MEILVQLVRQPHADSCSIISMIPKIEPLKQHSLSLAQQRVKVIPEQDFHL